MYSTVVHDEKKLLVTMRTLLAILFLWHLLCPL